MTVKGGHHSEETKRVLRERLKGNKNCLGRQYSPETIQKMSASHKGNQAFLGKHHTEETKQKISEWRTGRKFHYTDAQRHKMSVSHRGNKSRLGQHTPIETRRKLSIAGKNRPHSPTHRNAIQAAVLGKKNHNWAEGKSFEPYSIAWKRQLKEQVRERDGYKCQRCGCHQLSLSHNFPVHHIDYDKKNCVKSNLITLCMSCHSKCNKRREYWTRYFQALMVSTEEFRTTVVAIQGILPI